MTGSLACGTSVLSAGSFNLCARCKTVADNDLLASAFEELGPSGKTSQERQGHQKHRKGDDETEKGKADELTKVREINRSGPGEEEIHGRKFQYHKSYHDFIKVEAIPCTDNVSVLKLRVGSG